MISSRLSKSTVQNPDTARRMTELDQALFEALAGERLSRIFRRKGTRLQAEVCSHGSYREPDLKTSSRATEGVLN